MYSHTHIVSYFLFNVCMLKWSLMRCELRTAALLFPTFFYPSPLCLNPPASDRKRHTEWQRCMACSMLAGVGKEAVVELIGENGFFFSYLSIHHHVITARFPLTACERHFKAFLSWADVPVSSLSVFTCEGMCSYSVPVCGVCLCGAKQVMLDVLLAQEQKSLPAPTHNNPPHNYHFVVEYMPALLVHLNVCLSVNVCICLHTSQGYQTSSASAACPWFGWRAALPLVIKHPPPTLLP